MRCKNKIISIAISSNRTHCAACITQRYSAFTFSPTKYGNKTYTWEGKFLTEVADEDGSKTQFEYDANGFRTQKRQYGTDGRLEYYVEYLWLDGKLTQQALTLMAYRSDGTSYGIGPISAKFVYEENSQQPQSCLIGDTVLLFVRNLQGDVVAVVNGDGSIWAEFTYDAWGNVEVTSPLEDESIREAALKMLPLLCPLTYRGYNYDFTTGLYYLQSRYYNPEWGRFLNCDDTSILLATQGTTHGANLFAYCENNPVNFKDPTGYFKGEDHYSFTLAAASALFPSKYACLLAKGSMDVDTLHPPVAHFYNRYDQSFHFNVNAFWQEDSRNLRAQELFQQGWKYIDEAKAYKRGGYYDLYRTHLEAAFYCFGQGIHPLQDKIAHSGLTGNMHFIIPIGIVIKVDFYAHFPWYNDWVKGPYIHRIFGPMRKSTAAEIDTAFVIYVIFIGLQNRGITYRDLERAS